MEKGTKAEKKRKVVGLRVTPEMPMGLRGGLMERQGKSREVVSSHGKFKELKYTFDGRAIEAKVDVHFKPDKGRVLEGVCGGGRKGGGLRKRTDFNA